MTVMSLASSAVYVLLIWYIDNVSPGALCSVILRRPNVSCALRLGAHSACHGIVLVLNDVSLGLLSTLTVLLRDIH